MKLYRAGSRPSSPGPADTFTGAVRVDPLLETEPPARVRGSCVTFEPGARSHWHAHPLGQSLVVLAGCGRIQSEGQRVRALRPGDVVWTPADEKHWHGAAPTTSMTHLALHEARDGVAVVWMEPVTDAQYAGAPEDDA